MSFVLGGGDVLRKQVELLVNATGQQAVDDLARSLQGVEGRMAALQQMLRAGIINNTDFLDRMKDLAREHGLYDRAVHTSVEAQQAFARGFRSITEAREADARAAKVQVDEERRLAREADADLRRKVDAHRRATQEISDLFRAFDQEESERDRKRAARTDPVDDANRRSRAASRALLEFSRGLEDFTTAGFIGALNNIPTMFYNIGQSLGWAPEKVTGLTAVVSLLATATYAAYKNWDTLSSYFRSDLIDQQTGSVSRLKKEMEGLEKATYLTGEQMAKLGNLRREIAGREFAEKMAMDPTKQAQEVIKAFKEATQGAGGAGTIESAVHDAVVREFRGYSKEESAAALMEAGRRGELQDERGKAMRFFAVDYMQDEQYRRRMDAAYLASAGRAREQDILLQIGKKGDVGALSELERMLGSTGRFTIDERGKTVGAKGEEVKALSDLFGALPERAQARRAAEQAEKERVKEVEEKQKKAAQERQQEVNKITSRVTSGIMDQAVEEALTEMMTSQDSAKVAVAKMKGKLLDMMKTIGVVGKDAIDSVGKVSEDVGAEIDRRMLAAGLADGKTPEEAARRVLAQTKQAKERARAAAQAETEETQEEKARVAAGKRLGGPVVAEMDKEIARAAPGMEDMMAGFMARNQAALERRRLLMAQRGGKQEIAMEDRAADQTRRMIQQEINARNRDIGFKRQFAAMTPEEQAMLQLGDQMRLQTKPRSQQGAENLAAAMAAQAFRVGGPGKQDENLAGVMGQEMAGRAAKKVQGKFEGFLGQTGNALQAMLLTQGEIVAAIERHQGQLNRVLGVNNMHQARLRNNRQTQQNTPRN